MDWQGFVNACEARALDLRNGEEWNKCVELTSNLLEKLSLYDQVRQVHASEVLPVQRTCEVIEAKHELINIETQIQNLSDVRDFLQEQIPMKEAEIDALIKLNEPMHREKYLSEEELMSLQRNLKTLQQELQEKQTLLTQQSQMKLSLEQEKFLLEEQIPHEPVRRSTTPAPLPRIRVVETQPKISHVATSHDVLEPLDFCEFRNDPADGSKLLDNHTASVHCCKFGHSIPYIATGGADCQIRISDGYSRVTRVKMAKTVMSLDFSPIGDFMAAGSWDGSVSIFSTSSWSHKQTLKDNKQCINDVLFSSQENVISCCREGTVKLYDIRRGVALKKYQVASTPLSVSRVHGEGISVTSHYDGHIRAWDFRHDKCAYDVGAHKQAVLRVIGDMGSRRIVTLSADGTIAVRDIRAGNMLGYVRLLGGIPSDHVRFALWERYSNPIAIIGGLNGSIYYWDIEEFRLAAEVKGSGDPVFCVDFSGSSSRVISGHKSGVVKLWNVLPQV